MKTNLAEYNDIIASDVILLSHNIINLHNVLCV